MNYYSQFSQDRWLNDNIFKNKIGGYFIDLGCSHYKNISNTLMFEESLHWKGIGIDCVSSSVDLFNIHRKNKAILAAVSNIEDIEVDCVVGGSTTGIHDETSNEYIKTNYLTGNRIFKLKTTTLTKILIDNEAPYTIDFLSLDVEGHELQVLQGLDFSRFQIKVILVEKNKKTDLEIDTLLISKGYTKLKTPLPADWVYIL